MFGIRVMMHTMQVSKCVVGVERNKPDAIEALRGALPADLDITILPLTVKYPQGAEKMLIQAVTGVEVPSGKLPVSVGVVVQNVGSVAAIAEVFETGLPADRADRDRLRARPAPAGQPHRAGRHQAAGPAGLLRRAGARCGGGDHRRADDGTGTGQSRCPGAQGHDGRRGPRSATRHAWRRCIPASTAAAASTPAPSFSIRRCSETWLEWTATTT